MLIEKKMRERYEMKVDKLISIKSTSSDKGTSIPTSPIIK